MNPAGLSALEQRLCAAIAARAHDLLADLATHVAIPTGMGHAPGLDECRQRLTDRLLALGATLTLHPGDPRPDWLSESPRPPSAQPVPPPTAVCTRLARASKCRILLCGHIDTVHDPAGPFRSLTLSQDRTLATGPGCVDMKGGLVIALAALEALEACGVPASWGFALNSDEETGSFHSDAALRREATGYDVGLVMEPALPDGSLVIERPGSGQFRIDCEGTPAHVGRDFASGRSAILALADCTHKVARLVDLPQGRIASVGVIRGGTATNVVPHAASGWGNIRFRAEPDGESMRSSLLNLRRSDPGLRVGVRCILNRPAKPQVAGVTALAGAARAAAESLGQKLPFGTTGGVCDGNNLQAAGLPTIDTLGVRGGGLHTPTEWIEIASLVERCQLLALLIARLTDRGIAG
ncbi:MAG: M20/M25/M40 family metallo-hydrolase [Phycisphaerales bacterium]|nr:M20/M25/M40 family metallo-hydrolase [Phycisphaerales bacterium]